MRHAKNAEPRVLDPRQQVGDGRLAAVVDHDKLDRATALAERAVDRLKEPHGIRIPGGHDEADERRRGPRATLALEGHWGRCVR